MSVHLIFDLIASGLALAMTLSVYFWRIRDMTGDLADRLPGGYFAALIFGAILGAYGLGTVNLWLSGEAIVGRSILGALAGATLTIELWKARAGLRGSTGIVFVPGLATTIAVGRGGCFQSGLEDRTHGIPTTLPWGTDFGDGNARHPVQLYESAVMAAFLAGVLIALARRSHWVAAKGFYLFIGVYAAQRFVWEFLKPYGPVFGPFNIFHLTCAALMVYAALMLRRPAHVSA